MSAFTKLAWNGLKAFNPASGDLERGKVYFKALFRLTRGLSEIEWKGFGVKKNCA